MHRALPLLISLGVVVAFSAESALVLGQAPRPLGARFRKTPLVAEAPHVGGSGLASLRHPFIAMAQLTTNYGPDRIFGVPSLVPCLIFFGIFCTALTKVLAGMQGAWVGAVKLIYAGAIAGIISRTMCAPLEMVSTVMMCRGEGSLLGTMREAWDKAGLRGLFKGNGANCLKVAPSRGTQFLVFEFMKRRIVAGTFFFAAAGAPLTPWTRLFAGGVAGMAAAVLVYPLEVIKTILTIYPDEATGIGSAVECVFKYGGGMQGMYAGLLPTLVAMFPYIGVEFMVYETLKRQWEISTGKAAGTLIMLACGAISGAAGQASAHPLDVVRRRLQMQGIKAAREEEGANEADKTAKITNMFQGLYSIAKHEGWQTLFKGLGPACTEKVPSTAIGYYIYEALKVALHVKSV